jgi:hypothetical protein
VLVRDAETKKPIAGAEVRVSYPLSRPSQAPWDSVVQTGDDGVARVRAAAYGDAGIRVDAAANGYLSEDLSVPVETVREVASAHLFEDTAKRPARFVIEMYAEPGPRVELLVPNGFRGLIRAEVRVQEDAPVPPGQRVFRFPVEPPGVVQVSGPPLLRRIYAPDYSARFADGTLVKKAAGDWDVGLRPLKNEANVYYFVLGTQSEFDNIRRDLKMEAATASRSTPTSQGEGRHRRRGKGAGDPASSAAAANSP